MRTVSVSESNNQPEAANPLVLVGFIVFVITVLAVPLGMVWAASGS